MKKKVISTLTAAALVASVAPAVVTEAAPATVVKVDIVTAVDSKTVKVSYTMNKKKYSATVKTKNVIKHGASTVQFTLKGKVYSAKLKNKFVNKNYVSALSNVKKAVQAIDIGLDQDAIKAIKNASAFFSRIKTTELSSKQYSELKQQITKLQQTLTILETPVVPENFSATDVMKKSVEKMNAVKSMDSKLLYSMKMSFMDETLDMNMYGTMSTFAKPLLAKMNLTLDLGELKENVDMYMEEKDGKYITYTKVGSEWTVEEVKVTDNNAMSNPSSQLYMESFSEIKGLGTQTIDGKKMYVVEGKISGDALEKLIESTGALNMNNLGLTNLGLTAEEMKLVEEMMSNIFTDLGDMSMKMWINADDYYAVKYEMDITGFMQKMFDNIIKSMANPELGLGLTQEDIEMAKGMFKVEKVWVSMTNNNFDNVPTFTIPNPNVSEQPKEDVKPDTRTEITKIENSKYQSIVMVGAEGAYGTGFIIGKNKLLTNRHVVEGELGWSGSGKINGNVRLKNDAGEFLEFKIKNITHAPNEADMSLIEVSPTEDGRNIGDNIDMFELASHEEIKNTKVGDPVQTIGYPGDKKFGTMWDSKGKVLSQGGNFITYDAFIAGGNSGSPLLNKDGKLIGLSNAGNGVTTFGFLLTDELYEFVEKNR